MRLRVLLILAMGFSLAACGGAGTTSTLGMVEEAGDVDMTGLNFVVHQAPG